MQLVLAATDGSEGGDRAVDMAATLAGQTVYGAASLAAHSAETPETLRRQVTSPNGTTQAGLEVLMQELTDLVTRTVEAAKIRSIELRN